tara:strand:- start:530 stop:988 length:459 start_codon:yes stop_codon:yes gene_type:complete
MATATYTSSVFANNGPKQTHVGNVTVQGQYNAGSAVTSLGDVIFLAKIPHGAKIVDVTVDHSANETACGVDYGLAKGGADQGAASLSVFISALAKSTISRIAVPRPPGSGPVTVSVSDSDPVRYGIFGCKPVSGSASTSLMINFSITYRTDE